MSVSTTTPTGHDLPRNLFIGLARTFGAERLRARRSASARMPFLGLVMSLVQGVSWWTVSTQELSAWDQLFSWQALWVTGIAAPVTALLVGLACQREQRSRQGGTVWRPASSILIQICRATVIAGQLLALQLLTTVPIIVFGWLHGLTGAPVMTMVNLAIVLWVGSLFWAVLASAVSTVAGLWVAVGAGLIWQIAGTIQAESPFWAALPWTWSVRPALPLLGIHNTGIRLEPHSQVWDYLVWLPVALSLLAALFGVLTVTLITRHTRSLVTRLSKHLPQWRIKQNLPSWTNNPARPTVINALTLSLRRTSIGWLIGLTLVVMVLVAIIWPASYLPGLVALVVLPFGCCLLPSLVWSAQQPSWRVLALRRSPERLGLGMASICLCILSLIITCAGILMALHGTPTVLFVLVAWCTGTALLALNFWLVTHFGIGTAVGLTLIIWILGLVFGASQFAETPAWVGSFAIWPHAVDTPDRAVIAIPVSLAITLITSRIWLSSLRKAAAS